MTIRNLKITTDSVTILISMILFIISVYLLGNEKLLFKFVYFNTSGLESIGQNLRTIGAPRKRLLNDSLWNYASENEVLYSGDTYLTNEKSSIELALPKYNIKKIKISENSFVKLFIKNNKPLIIVERGKVEIEASQNTTVYVKNGAKTEEITIKKDQKDLRQQPESQNLNEDLNKTSDKSAAKKDEVVKEGDPRPIEAATGLANYKTPYPENNKLFFHGGSGQIVILPKKICSDKCILKVFWNEIEVNNIDFESGKVPFHIIKVPDSSAFATIRWRFMEGGESINGHFEVQPSSTLNMQNAIKEKRNLEIMGTE